MCLPLPGCVALPHNGLWKNGADEAAVDRSQVSHSGKDQNHGLLVLRKSLEIPENFL